MTLSLKSPPALAAAGLRVRSCCIPAARPGWKLSTPFARRIILLACSIPCKRCLPPNAASKRFRGATFAFAGHSSAAAWARELIVQLDGKPLAIDPRYWQHYHAGAVMACNYQVTLVDAALELMEIAGVGRVDALDALAPILRATIDNVLLSGPENALTGPIRRGDVGTIRRHLAALAETASRETQRLYSAAGLRTVAIAERAGLRESAARELVDVLSAPLGRQD